MPAKSKSQQRLFGMLHAYNKGELKGDKALMRHLSSMSKHISDEDATHFAQTPHKGLPEKKAELTLSGPIGYNNAVVQHTRRSDMTQKMAYKCGFRKAAERAGISIGALFKLAGPKKDLLKSFGKTLLGGDVARLTADATKNRALVDRAFGSYKTFKDLNMLTPEMRSEFKKMVQAKRMANRALQEEVARVGKARLYTGLAGTGLLGAYGLGSWSGGGSAPDQGMPGMPGMYGPAAGGMNFYVDGGPYGYLDGFRSPRFQYMGGLTSNYRPYNAYLG